jgi:uncharacterized protein (DUF1800 family)
MFRWIITAFGLWSLVFSLNSGAAQKVSVLGSDDARHLLNRTGFGAPPRDVAEFSRLTREQAVDRLLASRRTEPFNTPPVVEFVAPIRVKNASEEEKKFLIRAEAQKVVGMRAWWLQEMLASPTPADALRERMTLFWHNHFVSSQQKVKSAPLLLQQNLLLRRHALGNFGELLHAVSKDPAMIIYLDSATNRKGSPNENFAREVMELFTLGEGHYSEQDIKEAARAFTGWSVEPETGEFKWRAPAHDTGAKRVLGVEGDFDGDAVLDILLRQPAAAAFIAGKLWREFVSPQPEAKSVQRLATNFRDSGYEMKAVMRALLLSPDFWAKENRATLMKSPADLVVGSVRTLNVRVPDALPLAFTLRNLGQDLFAPPNVKGWPGGEAWINSTTLLARKQFVERLLRAEEFVEPTRRADGVEMRYEDAPMQSRRRVQQLREEFGKGAAALEGDTRMRMVQALMDIRFDAQRWLAQFPDRHAVIDALLPLAPGVAPAGELQGVALVRALALDPAYQLK